MKMDRFLLDQPMEDVRATMQEEGCGDCFGCPHATVLAATISRMADSTHETIVELSNRSDELAGLFEDPDDYMAARTAGFEKLQEEYREELCALTTPCIGWLDGAGTDKTPRPAQMCNSPESGDPKISIAAGWLLEKFSRRTES